MAYLLNHTWDLTGQIVKADSYPFANGGSSDIWKGRWLKPDSGQIEVIQVTNKFLLHANPDVVPQVAIKVRKRFGYDYENESVCRFNNSVVYYLSTFHPQSDHPEAQTRDCCSDPFKSPTHLATPRGHIRF